MTTSIFKSIRGYLLLASVLGGGVALLSSACDSPGSEGDACIAAESHNDCSGSLICFQPSLCANTYCCLPPDSKGDSPSTDPNCATGCNGGANLICEDFQANGAGFDGVSADAGAAACDFAMKHPLADGAAVP